jgi:hypothetical protein
LEKRKSRIGLLTILIILVVIIWALSGLFIIYAMDNWSDRGTFGDLFGAVNGLFSGLAFAGLIYTIVLQKRDLQMQRDEIRMNRTELKKSAKAQVKSEKALTEQVEQMKITSKLNALNTIINYYNLQISSQSTSPEALIKFKEKRRETIKEIDQLINRVGDDEID